MHWKHKVLTTGLSGKFLIFLVWSQIPLTQDTFLCIHTHCVQGFGDMLSLLLPKRFAISLFFFLIQELFKSASLHFPASLVAQQWRIHLWRREIQEMWVWSLSREDLLEEGMARILQHSCLENPMDRGAWRATVHGPQKSRTWLGD